jgi:PilZ domain
MRYSWESFLARNVSPENPINRRRSERVMLQVSVIVKTKTRQGQNAEEETHTMVVNAHGGLMRLKMELQTGQPIVLINAKTKMEQSCRVVRVENPSGGGNFAVAFEFDRPAPHFWPITFPPADWGVKPS